MYPYKTHILRGCCRKMAGSHARNYCITYPVCNPGENELDWKTKKNKSLWIQYLLPKQQKCFLYSRNFSFKTHTEFFVKLKRFNQLPTNLLVYLWVRWRSKGHCNHSSFAKPLTQMHEPSMQILGRKKL